MGGFEELGAPARGSGGAPGGGAAAPGALVVQPDGQIRPTGPRFVRAMAVCAAIPVAAFVYCVGQGTTGPVVAELLLQRAC
jgi:hypothetical protein